MDTRSTAGTDDADAQAMIRLSSGQDAALNELMERHANKLFGYLMRSLQDEQDASDLAQESFVRVYQHRNRYNPKQKFSTWLYAIATNLVKDRYRWRSRHPQVSLDSENEDAGGSLGNTLPDPDPAPHEQLQTVERATLVRQAVARLPEELRMPLILAEYEERSHQEIGEILGCTRKAVETRIYRARNILRSQLSELLERQPE